MSTSASEIAATLQNFTRVLATLSDHPDKAVINALTMAAEDVLDVKAGAVALWSVLAKELQSSVGGRLMSLLYLVDSILVNADDDVHFRSVALPDMKRHLLRVIRHSRLGDKAERLVNIWSTERGYETEGFRFAFQEERDARLKRGTGAQLKKEELVLTALSSEVRKEMEEMLRQMQEEMGEVRAFCEVAQNNEAGVSD